MAHVLYLAKASVRMPTTIENYIVFICLLFMCSSMAATDYYVATDGTNAAVGSISAPWATIQYGVDQLSAGDNLYIRAGTYMEKIEIGVSGTVSSRITIAAYQEEVVMIDGSADPSKIAILEIADQSYLTIQGLHFTNNKMLDAQGILISGSGDGIYLLDNKVSDIDFSTDPNETVTSTTNAQGIIVYGTNGTDAITDLKINNNEVYDCLLGFSESLAINGNVDGWEVIGNAVHDNSNIGIDIIGHEGEAPANDQARNGVIQNNTVYNCLSPYATSGGIYVDGGKDIIIENNITYNNGYGIEIGCENINKTTSGIIVRNNVIYNNQIAGLSLGGFAYPTTGKVIDCQITGNTFYQNNFEPNSFNGEMYLSYSEDCTISSNIFYLDATNTFAYADLSQPNLVMDYNNIYLDAGAANFEVSWNGTFYFGYSNYLSGTSLDANSTFGDPTFVNASFTNPDFHLQSGSAAIDKGDPNYTVNASEVDLDGHGRVVNSIIDCGADESGSSANCATDYVGVNQLTGALTADVTYETIGAIESDQVITNSAVVVYRALGGMDLLDGFSVAEGVIFSFLIKGCE